MSAPAPPPTNNSAISAKFSVRKKQERKHRRRTLTISVVLHGALIVTAIYLTPWQKLIDEATAKQPVATRMISTTEVKRLDERIEALNAKKMREQIRALQAFQDRVQAVEAQSQKTYEPHQQKQKTKAPEQAQQLAQEALQAMQRAKDALEQNNPQAARQEQTQAEQLQHDALGKLTMLSGDTTQEAVAAQELARTAQREASAQAAQPLDAPPENVLRHKQGQADHRQQQADHQQKTIEHIQKTIEKHQRDIQKRRDANTDLEKKLQGDSLKKIHQRTRTQIQQNLNYIRTNEQHIEGNRKRIEQHQQQAEKHLAERRALLDEIEAANKQVIEQSAAAHKLQQAALDAQAQAIAKIQAAAEAAQQTNPRDNTPQANTPNSTKPATRAQTHEDLANKSIAELYQTAEATEQALTDAFENIRAMELAVIRDTSLKQARAAVDDVTPIRDGIDREALAAKAKTGQDLEGKREAVSQALRETQAMVDLALLLESQLTQEADGQGAGRLALALASTQAQADTAPGSSANEGGDQQPAAARPAEAASQKPDSAIAGTPGRRISSTGQPAEWLSIDSWYVIGPWDNTGRRNLSRQFPPESIIDLDAVYLGKRGELIRWRFVNTTHPQGFMKPLNAEPYGVWYATTEIHLDKAQTLWVALGSDDRGTLWVNGQRVWLSAPEHKIWRAHEAVVPVAFAAGNNRLLLRCENGQSTMGFSMSIKPAAPQP